MDTHGVGLEGRVGRYTECFGSMNMDQFLVTRYLTTDAETVLVLDMTTYIWSRQ